MRFSYSSTLLVLSTLVSSGVCADKTLIYIDRVPEYSKLPDCAQERISAIVRAQSSGCGDYQALTSFRCFCVESSSFFNSIISTDVAASCAAATTTTTTTTTTRIGRITSTKTAVLGTTAMPEIASALDVFHSYCEKTTELAWYANNVTATVIITQAPPTTTAIPTSSAAPSTAKKTPAAAIAAPVVVGVLAIVGSFGIFLWLRRRRATKQTQAYGELEHHGQKSVATDSHVRGEMAGDYPTRQEVPGDTVKYRYELENRGLAERVELDGSSSKEQPNVKK